MRIVYNNRYGCIRICDKLKKKHVVHDSSHSNSVNY